MLTTTLVMQFHKIIPGTKNTLKRRRDNVSRFLVVEDEQQKIFSYLGEEGKCNVQSITATDIHCFRSGLRRKVESRSV